MLTLLLLSTFYWRITYIQKHVQLRRVHIYELSKSRYIQDAGIQIKRQNLTNTSRAHLTPFPFTTLSPSWPRLAQISLAYFCSLFINGITLYVLFCFICSTLYLTISSSSVCWQSFNNWLIAGSQHEVSDQSWEVSGSSQLQHNTELIHPYCCRFILMIIVPQKLWYLIICANYVIVKKTEI